MTDKIDEVIEHLHLVKNFIRHSKTEDADNYLLLVERKLESLRRDLYWSFHSSGEVTK